MNRYEIDFYSSDVPAIRKALERIANALEEKNKLGKLVYKDDGTVDFEPKDIPGFEGTLDALDNLYQPTSSNPDPAGYANEASFAFAKAVDEACNKDEYEYEYEYDLQGIRVDSDHDIRSTAAYYEREELDTGATKKDCILDYVTNEFGSHGARYTDIIKFAYYLGEHNALKYTNANRGYYACAFNTNGFGGHLVQGGKDQLVKGINKEGKERYFALSFVESATAYWKRIS